MSPTPTPAAPLVVLTLAAAKAEGAAAAFRAAGLRVALHPFVEPRALDTAPLEPYTPADRAVAGWIVTSATTVEVLGGLEAFAAEAGGAESWRDRLQSGRVRVAAVGPATAAACRAAGWGRVVESPGAGQEGVAALATRRPDLFAPGATWWFPGSAAAGRDLEEALAARGVTVRPIPIYEPVALPHEVAAARRVLGEEAARAGAPPAWLAFFSPSAVDAWFDTPPAPDAPPAPTAPRLAAMGARTAAHLAARAGAPPDLAGDGRDPARLAAHIAAAPAAAAGAPTLP